MLSRKRVRGAEKALKLRVQMGLFCPVHLLSLIKRAHWWVLTSRFLPLEHPEPMERQDSSQAPSPKRRRLTSTNAEIALSSSRPSKSASGAPSCRRRKGTQAGQPHSLEA